MERPRPELTASLGRDVGRRVGREDDVVGSGNDHPVGDERGDVVGDDGERHRDTHSNAAR